MRTRLTSLACLGASWSIASSVSAATRHVDDDAPDGGEGSAASPFNDLQAAIDAAAAGDDILVAGGTYAAIAVDSRELHLFGGYDAGFTQQGIETPSTIEGTPTTAAVSLFEVGDSILDGFVLRGGQRGLFIDADYLSTTNRPAIRNNIIENNGDPTLSGGGVFADHCDASFTGNTVRDNVGDRGSGIATTCASVLIEDNVVEGNVSSGDHGGGLYLTGTTVVVRDNVVRDNEVGVSLGYGWGAGVTVYGEGVTATFERNVFTENLAQSVGSGAFIDDGATAQFVGDLFFGNRCGSTGGALYVDGYDTNVSSSVTLVNVTIASHDCPGLLGSAIYVEAQSTVLLVNSIVWGNGGDDFNADATSSITATYTLGEEALEGVGNLSADPLFADPTAGDFHVRSTMGRFDPAVGDFVMDDVDSPSIDAGDPAADFALEPAPNGLRVNLGHTGNTAEASKGGPGGGDPTSGDSSASGTGSNDGATASGADGTGSGGTGGGTLGGSDDAAAGNDDTEGCGCKHTTPARRGSAAFTVVMWLAARRRRSPAP